MAIITHLWEREGMGNLTKPNGHIMSNECPKNVIFSSFDLNSHRAMWWRKIPTSYKRKDYTSARRSTITSFKRQNDKNRIRYTNVFIQGFYDALIVMKDIIGWTMYRDVE